ncbi:PREDICTED: uncharacterized protein LOC106742316 isoform X2 [Dinoponera quadriceps]|uniref:Uncharacterized protein LOC106742316 isoform X2 n=1 Tax=Dinoponera quadriceps TaxID=609295 RepID=A0A6P3WWZ2_DINQU|nr:PREDICTED: uncharacterized protein LOC106742316 isoform X2 [Dinoponera quadriceps]
MWQCLWMLFVLLACVSGENQMMGGHLDNNAKSGKNSSALGRKRHVDDLDPDLVAEESTVASSTDNDVPPRYHIPYPFAFNGGKPFSLEKDPITGKIDFEKAPLVRALNYTGRYHQENADGVEDTAKINDDDVSPNEINTYTVNFHDFLNLPINYSSDRYIGNDKYPLISNSYANTKVQSGGNSYNTYNHRPYHVDTHPAGNPYVSMKSKTDLKAKLSTVAIILSTTKAPAVTTWKPSTTPTALRSIIDRTIAEENEKVEESMSQLGADKSNIPNETIVRYKNQPTLNNFVLPHQVETRPQHEEYQDSYDIDEDEEAEEEEEVEDYTLSLQERKNHLTPSNATIVDATTTRTFQEDLLASNSLESSITKSPVKEVLNSGQSITERYDSNTRSTIKSGQDGAEVVSTSNIVIPPDQDTVSFVLGNRQNVDGGYYSIGTATGENPYGSSSSDIETLRTNPPHSPIKEMKYHASVADRLPMQKWWLPGPLQSSFAATIDTNNGKDAIMEEHIDGESPTTNLPTADGDLPQLAENLMPPAPESSGRPPYHYHYHYDTLRTEVTRLPPRIHKPHSGSPLDVAGPRRRPYSPDAKLPNILPQFRPNAKASHGHRFGSDVIGTMPAGLSQTRIRQNHPSSRRPFPPPPSYLQRLNPPPPPIHAVRLKVDASTHETEPTIRKFRPPHYPVLRGSTEGSANKSIDRSTEQNEQRNESGKTPRGKSEVADESSENLYPEEPPPRPPLFPKRRTADPLHVTTLQMMIQHHGENEAKLVQPVVQAERRKSSDIDDSLEMAEQPVYVVYPVNTAVNIHNPDDSKEKDGSVVVGTRGPHRPLPPDTLLQDEKIHTVYNGRPAVDFPYPLERPDPLFPGTKETPLLVPSDQRQQIITAPDRNEQDAINVIPYLQDFLPFQKKNDAAISVTLHRTASITTPSSTSETPIAYVYTPTYPTHLDDGAATNIDGIRTATVLLPSQQPSSSSSSAPAPQHFMAPFVASISAETPSKNGWSVVVVDPSEEAAADKKLDSDDDAKKLVSPEMDNTEKNDFDVDNFKPQLFGGFKPIYEFPTEDVTGETSPGDDKNIEADTSRHSKGFRL